MVPPDGFEWVRGIIETVQRMTPAELRRDSERMRAKWESIGCAFPLYCLLLLLSEDSPRSSEWQNISRPVTDRQAALALGITRSRARRWRQRLAAAKLAIFLPSSKGCVVIVRDNPAMRQLLTEVLAMGRNTGEVSAAGELDLRRTQLLRAWPAATEFLN